MASGGDEITIGYWYSMGAHMAVAHTVDAWISIRAGDKNAWIAPESGITSTTTIYIDNEELFGGEKREGGILGYVDLVMGTGAEPVNDYLAAHLEADPPGAIPAFRGVSCAVLKQPRVMANNPNVRPWNFEVFCQPAKGWYPETEILYNPDFPGNLSKCDGVNPAHMVRECLTNAWWGLGHSPLEIDDDSFRAAALILYNEKFGINLVWDRETQLMDFIGTIISHIDGTLYVHPYTGLYTLKLFRKDYVVANLPIMDETNIVDLRSYDRLSVGELINQMVVIWYDHNLDKQRSVTAHNTVVRELQGGVVSSTVELPGISTADLASKVVTRELKKNSTALSRVSIITGRIGATFGIGDLFKLNWADYGISGVVYRIARIGYNAADSNQTVIDAVEDIFAFGTGLYAPPDESAWKDPISAPQPAPYHQATEAPYILIERRLRESQALIAELDQMAGFLTYQASSPSQDAFSYTLYTRVGTNPFVQQYVGLFTPVAQTISELVPEITSTVGITALSNSDILAVPLNTYAHIGPEVVEVIARSATSLTLKRGILDTVPISHPTNSIIFFSERRQSYDYTQWVDGSQVQAKASPLTGKGSLSLALTPTDTLQIKRRWYRPYPPGNLKVNGVRWPQDAVVGEPEFTWSHRDRTTQLAYYVGQDEGNFGPEAGVTYTIRIYDRNNALKRTVTGLTGTSWTYLSADQVADALGAAYTFTIASVRDGLESWQANRVIVYTEAIGYGYGYGYLYGGFTGEIGFGEAYGQFYGRFFG